MPTEQYREMVSWTAQQVLSERGEPPPNHLAEMLQQWNVNASCWQDAVKHFADWFHHAVGQASKLTEILDRKSQRWVHRIRHCREVFRNQDDTDKFT